ncbi:protein DA1-related 2-like isoform X2 [Lycium barbarum]|uniref:protein DA1-related 2-like isoform X2 n=1 Tax=Lycium barbarum TaxID=112863 RepID=UPI00293E31E7|nr:protein DA1-related 2-like isoform X2 [Lycium barbarum]
MPCSTANQPAFPYERKKSSKFIRWLSNLFKGNRGGLGEDNMALTPLEDDSWGSKEKEEVDQSIARSLAKDSKRPNGQRPVTDNDARNSLNSSTEPPYWDYNARGCRKCSGCQGDIGSGNYLGCMGTFFHPECFLCHACGFPITEYEIPTNGAGLIEYRCHPFWSQKYCPSHENDDTKRCCSCERLESRNTRYVSLGDGRSLCLECMESAIVDTGDCQQLYHAIRDFYEGMNMAIDQQIPMLLVERQALNEAIEGEKHGFHHMPETRGLCLSEEQTVTSILKRSKMAVRGLVGLRTQPQKLTRKCEVTAILVLYGLPRLLTGVILAHELMHAWLRLKGFRNLSPEVEEGICQVLSQMWLESEVMPRSRNMPSTSTASYSKKGGKSEVENKLGEFFMHQITHDASPAYGAGFRAANAAANKYGLRHTLDHIRLTGSFPL